MMQRSASMTGWSSRFRKSIINALTSKKSHERADTSLGAGENPAIYDGDVGGPKVMLPFLGQDGPQVPGVVRPLVSHDGLFEEGEVAFLSKGLQVVAPNRDRWVNMGEQLSPTIRRRGPLLRSLATSCENRG